MIIHKKSVVESDADIVPEGEELPLRLAETVTEPMLVADTLWMPYASYEKLRDFIYAREMDILKDIEDLGPLFSVLQWVNRIENDLQSSTPTARKNQ